MFPLGTALLPGQVLPLQIFEPRYHALLAAVRETDDRFGSVLIDRGSEVGGGDHRRAVGTMADILRAEQTPDGRWQLMVIGTDRFRVVEWLDDAPYPRAAVELWPDPSPTPDELHLLASVRAVVIDRLRSAAERRGLRVPDLRIDDDPVRASHQLAALALLGPHDTHTLLAAPTVGLRLALLHQLLADTEGGAGSETEGSGS